MSEQPTERRVFTVDVGSMTEQEVKDHLEAVKREFRRARFTSADEAVCPTELSELGFTPDPLDLSVVAELDDYQRLAFRTAKVFDSFGMDMAHASLGMVTEVGEFTTEVKRVAIYDKWVTDEMKAHMAEELGDLLWYVALAATHLGTSLSKLATANIEKLRLRFPDRYSNEAAEARADKGGLDARQS